MITEEASIGAYVKKHCLIPERLNKIENIKEKISKTDFFQPARCRNNSAKANVKNDTVTSG